VVDRRCRGARLRCFHRAVVTVVASHQGSAFAEVLLQRQTVEYTHILVMLDSPFSVLVFVSVEPDILFGQAGAEPSHSIVKRNNLTEMSSNAYHCFVT
jgi:hypothetical protein